MKTLLVATMIAVFSFNAHADGFRCEATREDLNVKVFNHTDPSDGTRNASVMILSDSGVSYGNKTIAKFTDVNSTLSNRGALYLANVDLRFVDSRRKGELIAGTKLGYLKQITLSIDFSYASPIEHEETVPAQLSLIKRDGEVIDVEMTCSRYLKN